MAAQATQRLITLDVFRGMTVFLMIVVNTAGSGAKPFPALLHSDWNGCTLTDLVFPSFLFAVGNSMVFADRKYESMGITERLCKILNRGLLICITGFLLTWFCTVYWNAGSLSFARLADTRIMAVLQRIGICYVMAGIIIQYANPRGMILLSIFILVIYWGLLYWMGTPGSQFTLTGNAVRKMDLLLIGERHMYREHGISFDPEGMLSSIPAVVNVLAGYLSGLLIIKKGKTMETVARLLLIGSLLVLAGIAWDYLFPINKKLWTSSYVCFSVGIDMLVLGTLLYGIEIKSWKMSTRFFSVFGKNPLFIYVLSNFFIVIFILKANKDTNLFDWINLEIFQRIAPGPLGSLCFAVCFTGICWLPGKFLDYKKIYIRL